MRIGILGGTGAEGRGLATRLAIAGHEVVIGSRDPERAAQAATELTVARGESRDGGSVSGDENAAVAQHTELVFVAVPYAGLEDTLEQTGRFLHNKICVSVVSPIEVVGGTARLISLPAGSAAEEAERIVPGARWVAGLHSLPARDLEHTSVRLDTDCLLCSDDTDAYSTVSELMGQITGLRPVNCGRLENARYLEGITALLINVNRIHKAHASVRIVGV